MSNLEENKTKMLDKFQLNRFTATKSSWNDFKFEVEHALSMDSRTLDHGREYLFEVFPVNADGEREIPVRFQRQEVPESLTDQAGVTEARQRQRGALRKEVIESNKERASLIAACMQIVVSRVNDAIKRDLQTVAGDDANLAWRRLEELYGPASSGNNDFSTAFYRCLGSRMDPQMRFDAFMTQFEIDAAYCKLSSAMKRAVLLSDKSNSLKAQCLPDRLMEHVAHCI